MRSGSILRGGAGSGGRLIQRTVAQGPQRQFGPAGDIQFAEDVVEVFFHGTFREAQVIGDFLVGFGFGDERYDLTFPKGERAGVADETGLGPAAGGTGVLFSG